MSTAPAQTEHRASARERLLAAADELFYSEGVQTVGIDRIIEHAGVAKASLYNLFGSKEALVAAYLASRHDRTTSQAHRGDREVRRSASEDPGRLRRPGGAVPATRLQRLRLHRRLHRGTPWWPRRACCRRIPGVDPRHVHRSR